MRRRRAGCGGLGLLGLALVALPSARPDLLVVSGPPEMLGLRLAAVPYEFAPQTFGLSGRLKLVEPSEWSDDCPPAYTGSESLADLVLVAVDISPETLCSYEKRATGARHAGAAAWVTAVSGADALAALDPVPGFNARSYREGDTRRLAGIVAADVRSVTNYGLVGALRAGADVRVSLAPTPSRYAATFASPAYIVWQAVIVLHAASVLELALCRSYAFVRADGGVRLNRQQAVLWAESLASLARIAYFAADPIEARGLFSRTISRALFMGQLALGQLATAVFDVLFAEAVTASGLAQCRLAMPLHKRALIGGALGIIGMEALVAIIHSALAPRSASHASLAWQFEFAFASLLLVGAIFPGLLIVISWGASAQAKRATTSATDAPRSRLLSELMQWMQLTVWYQLAAFPLVLVLPWAFQGPTRQLLVLLALMVLVNAKSYVQVFAIRPVYERPPQGPLKLLRDATAALLRLACERPQHLHAGSSRLVEQANIVGVATQRRNVAAQQRAAVVPLTPIPEASVASAKASRGSSEVASRPAPQGSILSRWLQLGSSSSYSSGRTTAAWSSRKSHSPLTSKRGSVEELPPPVALASSYSSRKSVVRRESLVEEAGRGRPSLVAASANAQHDPPAASAYAPPVAGGGASGGVGVFGGGGGLGSNQKSFESAGSRRGKTVPACSAGAAGSSASALGRVSRLLASRGRTNPVALRVSNSSSSIHDGTLSTEASPNPASSPAKFALLAAGGKGLNWEESGAPRPSLSPNLEVVAEADDSHPNAAAASSVADGRPSAQPVRGIRLAALRALIAAHALDESVSTAAVGALLNAKIVDPDLAYVDTCLQSELGPASAVVLHAADCSFLKLVEALEAHAEGAALEPSRGDMMRAARGAPPTRALGGACFWLDALCARPSGALADAAAVGARAQALGKVVIVLEPLNGAAVLRQTPTLYQLAGARGLRVYATATRAERERLQLKVALASWAATRSIKEDLVRTVDARTSRAGSEREKQLLLLRAHAERCAPTEPLDAVCAHLSCDARDVLMSALSALVATLLVPADEPPQLASSEGSFRREGSACSPACSDAERLATVAAISPFGGGLSGSNISPQPGSLSKLRAKEEIEQEVEMRLMQEIEKEESKRIGDHESRRRSITSQGSRSTKVDPSSSVLVGGRLSNASGRQSSIGPSP